MHAGTVAVAVAISVGVFVAMEFARPSGARVFNRGKNGENVLVFDPTSAPKK